MTRLRPRLLGTSKTKLTTLSIKTLSSFDAEKPHGIVPEGCRFGEVNFGIVKRKGIMRKFLELRSGCMAKAFPDEPTFVLLARDTCAPVAIRAWIEARIVTGKNTRNDAQISEALQLVRMMEMEQSEWHKQARMDAEGVTEQDIAETRYERP